MLKNISSEFKNIFEVIDKIQENYKNADDIESKIELTIQLIQILRGQKEDDDTTGINNKFIKKLDILDSLLPNINILSGLNITAIYLNLEQQLNSAKEKLKKLKSINATYYKNISKIIDDFENKIKDLRKNITLGKIFDEIFNSDEAKKFFNLSLIDDLKEKFQIDEIKNQISEIKGFISNLEASLRGDFDATIELIQTLNILRKNENFQNFMSLKKAFKSDDTKESKEFDLQKSLTSLGEIFNKVNKTIVKFNKIRNFYNNLRDITGFGNKRYLSNDEDKIRRLEDPKIECKIDDSIPQDKSYSINTDNPNYYILEDENNINYNIKILSNLKIKNSKEQKCDFPPKVGELKKNIIYKSNTNFTLDQIKRRIKFHMRINIAKITRPTFFFLILKAKINKKNTQRFLADETEGGDKVNIFCFPEDKGSSVEDFPLGCFGFNDNFNEEYKDGQLTLDNITSDYINLPENMKIYEIKNSPSESSDSPTNPEINKNSFRKSKNSGLSGGTIAGIVIGSVALAAIIAGLSIFLSKKKQKQTPQINYDHSTMKALKIQYIK